jgi:Uma2 family endonuclease
MSMAFDDLPYRMSFEAFLDFEDGAEFRHEYIGGTAYSMAGGTIAHNRIAVGLTSMLLQAVRGSSCRVLMSDVLLRAGTDAFYPDVMVACDAAVHSLYETSPCLVIEVVSPSTEKYDRTAKHAAYTNVESVMGYVLVSGDPTQPWAEFFRRAGDLWVRERLGPDDELRLRHPEVTIKVSDIFANIG